jgi:cell division protease FtsH
MFYALVMGFCLVLQGAVMPQGSGYEGAALHDVRAVARSYSSVLKAIHGNPKVLASFKRCYVLVMMGVKKTPDEEAYKRFEEELSRLDECDRMRIKDELAAFESEVWSHTPGFLQFVNRHKGKLALLVAIIAGRIYAKSDKLSLSDEGKAHAEKASLYALAGLAGYNTYELVTALREKPVSAGGSDVLLDDAVTSVEAKKALKTIIDVSKNPERTAHLGVEPAKSILLVGPDADEKRRLVQACAVEAGYSFASFPKDSLYLHRTEAQIEIAESLFNVFMDYAPTLVYFEDFDACAQAPGQLLLFTLLKRLKDVSSKEVLFVGSSEAYTSKIQAVARRIGIEKAIILMPPSREERVSLLELHTRYIIVADDVSFDQLADATEGFSASDIRKMVKDAGNHAYGRGHNEVAMEDFLAVVHNVQSGSSPESGREEKMLSLTELLADQKVKASVESLATYLKNPEGYPAWVARPRVVLLASNDAGYRNAVLSALARDAECPIVVPEGRENTEITNFFYSYDSLRGLFERAADARPSILFIDKQVLVSEGAQQFFNDVYRRKEPVIVVVAADSSDEVNPSFIQHNGINRVIDLPRFDSDMRSMLLNHFLSVVPHDEGAEGGRIAQECEGFLYNDLKQVVFGAAHQAHLDGRDVVTGDDLRAQVKELRRLVAKRKSTQGAEFVSGEAVSVRFDDVAGIDEAKAELKEVVSFLKNPEQFKKIGVKPPRGVMLYGPPGNGKTMLAKAVAGEAGCSFIATSGSSFVEMYVGVGAARVRSLFAQARKNAPCVVFIDEIDAVGGKRRGGDGGSQERDQTLNQILVELDGIQSEGDQVIVIAATNRLDMLDDALIRPGRFDRKIEVTPPDLKGRLAILKVHASRVALAESVDLERVARATTGYSGADLAGLVNEAALGAARAGKDAIDMHDFEQARDRMYLGLERPTLTISDHDREMTAYHEAGHSLLRILLPETDPLHKVTIAPRGSALGASWSLPEDDTTSPSEEALRSLIKVCLGGMLAEEIVFGKKTTGASNDIYKATQIARRMVCEFGMSPLGPIALSDREYGEDARKEVAIIVKDCKVDAEKVLRKNRDKLDILARALIERETLDASEVYELLGLPPIESRRID